jgi:hypothetical protein
MRAMRLAHDAGSEDDAVRPRMAHLASRFPGALREIDELELGEIERRIGQLDAALQGRGAVEAWMSATARFHALTRGALCAKRWLDGRKRVDESTLRAFEVEAADLAYPDDARAWASELARIASPPDGRVTRLVFARLAEELGISEGHARNLVFPARRKP